MVKHRRICLGSESSLKVGGIDSVISNNELTIADPASNDDGSDTEDYNKSLQG